MNQDAGSVDREKDSNNWGIVTQEMNRRDHQLAAAAVVSKYSNENGQSPSPAEETKNKDDDAELQARIEIEEIKKPTGP